MEKGTFVRILATVVILSIIILAMMGYAAYSFRYAIEQLFSWGFNTNVGFAEVWANYDGSYMYLSEYIPGSWIIILFIMAIPIISLINIVLVGAIFYKNGFKIKVVQTKTKELATEVC